MGIKIDNNSPMIRLDQYIVTNCTVTDPDKSPSTPEIIFAPKAYDLPVSSGDSSNDYYKSHTSTTSGSIAQGGNGAGNLDISADWVGIYTITPKMICTGAEFTVNKEVFQTTYGAVYFDFYIQDKTGKSLRDRIRITSGTNTIIIKDGSEEKQRFNWTNDLLYPKFRLNFQQKFDTSANAMNIDISLTITNYVSQSPASQLLIPIGELKNCELDQVVLECEIDTRGGDAQRSGGGDIEVLSMYVIDQYPLTT